MANSKWHILEAKMVEVLRQQGWNVSKGGQGEWVLYPKDNKGRIFNVSYVAKALSKPICLRHK